MLSGVQERVSAPVFYSSPSDCRPGFLSIPVLVFGGYHNRENLRCTILPVSVHIEGSGLLAKLTSTQNNTLQHWQSVLHSNALHAARRDPIIESWKRCEAWGVSRNPDAIPSRRISEEDLNERLRQSE